MVDALITFSEGQDILASEANQNNQFLLSKLSDNAAQLTTYVEEEITSIQSNVATVRSGLESKIEEVNAFAKTKLEVIETYKEATSWYRIYSDGWVEQGGRRNTSGAITFLIPFADADYCFTAAQTTTGSSSSEHVNAYYFNSKTTTSINLKMHQSEKPYVTWFACGFKAEEEE